jgi:ATP-dependent DNA helicase RecG
VRVSHIQVRMLADRLEVQNPGGLYGGDTVDELKEGQSTRNLLLVQLMEDVHLVENRGSDIDATQDAMRMANLQPPSFEDKRTSFLVVLCRASAARRNQERCPLRSGAARPLDVVMDTIWKCS